AAPGGGAGAARPPRDRRLTRRTAGMVPTDALALRALRVLGFLRARGRGGPGGHVLEDRSAGPGARARPGLSPVPGLRGCVSVLPGPLGRDRVGLPVPDAQAGGLRDPGG